MLRVLDDMISDLENVIENSGASNIVIGGNLNFDIKNSGLVAICFVNL